MPSLTRRRFLNTTSKGAAVAAAGVPFFVPGSVFGAPGQRGANERVTTGHIGVGGMGGVDLSNIRTLEGQGKTRVLAVCDVDEKRLKTAVTTCGAGVMPYRDYRYLLERKDIDAVVIATPDHWHAVQTVHACESGKHVYVEKPASCTVSEGQAMVAAAREHGRKVQVGSQARSAEPAWQACTYIRNGMLGTIKKVTTWHTPNPTGGTGAPGPVPPEIEWDLWLGPLRWRPYVPGAYCHGVFRWLMESGGGVIRDRGAHVMSIILWCMNADDQTPVSVEATGTPPNQGIWDCPPTMRVVYTFKNPDWELIWEQPGTTRGDGGFGMVFHGERDSLVVCRDGTRIPAEEKARRFKVPAGGVEVYRMDKHADYNVNHKEDWLQAILHDKTPCMDIAVAHRVATMNNLGNLSYLLGRNLRWDGRRQCVLDDEQANRMLGRPQRHPYHL